MSLSVISVIIFKLFRKKLHLHKLPKQVHCNNVNQQKSFYINRLFKSDNVRLF